jgi:folylpolyglutamate synthase
LATKYGVLSEQYPTTPTDSLSKTSDLNSLNAIHIAGTKGKGSTAAFVSSILNEFRQFPEHSRPQKVGLYTSPHLRFVRERIQLNGAPLTEAQFTRYFFETWDRLEHAATAAGQDPKAPTSKPVYFRFLTLMAFHTFKTENVDAAIIECGIGGAYDSTNILATPTATAITNLGIDHVGVLGNTLPEIAWHKAGIMKRSAPCFTTSTQDPAAKRILDDVAAKVPTNLTYIDTHPAIANGTWPLGLQASFQRINASLALAIATQYLSSRSPPISTTSPAAQALLASGLARSSWPGRCETRHESPTLTWCIDGGHTLDSIQLAGKWFAEQLASFASSSPSPSPAGPSSSPTSPTASASPEREKQKIRTYLIFNQQTRERSASHLALALHATLTPLLHSSTSPTPTFNTVIFCTNTTYVAAGTTPDLVAVGANENDVDALTVQNELAETWRRVEPNARVEVRRTIEEAVEVVREDSEVMKEEEKTRKVVLVTGSLHLVGGVLEVLEGERPKS